jgi:hypothetical protein
VPKHSSADGNGDAEVNEADHTIWRGNFGASFPGAGTGTAVTGSDSRPVLPSNSTEASPAAARDEVLTGFTVGSSSADSRTTRTALERLPEKSRLSDGNLLCVVTHEKREYVADDYDSLGEVNSNDHTDAVDELFSDLDCELIKMH